MTKAQPISSTDLYLQLGTARAPVLIDVRTDLNSDPDRRLIVGARPMPVTPEQWTIDLESGQRLVVYDSQGDETSEGVAEALMGFGKDAHYLDGGFAAWVAQGLPTRKQLAADVHKWITRERPKIDRIACPWLIGRFIDPDAEFIYVPTDRVLGQAKAGGPSPMTFLMLSSPMKRSGARSTLFCACMTSQIRRLNASP
jgi:rhodanese-related sulfurtransferase